MRKSSQELEAKIQEMCAIDATIPPCGMDLRTFSGCKVGAVKALLWALGINDDDRFHVPLKPGAPVSTKSKQ